jgi:hypothetical protein
MSIGGFHLSRDELKQAHPHRCRMMPEYRVISMAKALVDVYEDEKREGGIVKNRLMIHRAEDRAGRAAYHGSGRPTLHSSQYYPGGAFGCALHVLKGILTYVLKYEDILAVRVSIS